MTEPGSEFDADADYRARLAAEHDRQRRHLIGVVPLVLGLSVALGGVATLSVGGIEGVPRSVSALALVAGVLLLIWGLVRFQRTQPDEASLRLIKETEYGEGVQRGRRHAMLFLFIPLGGLMPMAMDRAYDLATGQGDGWDVPTVVVILVMPWLSLLILAGRDGGITPRLKRHIDDEHSRVSRRRAMTFGFLVLLAAMTGLYGIGLWRPAVMITLTPLALWLGALAAAARFALLERAAERGDQHG